MRCPFCQALDSRVIESRANDDQYTVRRRRECIACQRRFTTYERVELGPLMVVKKDRTREEFDREKIRRGIVRACEKRPISFVQIEEVVDEIERELRAEYEREVPSAEIGVKVMQRLRSFDGVAYVRFASVYREFRDVETFAKEILQLLHQQANQENTQD
ncbi:MAG: transcriptional regulator NrdR [Acidibacillus sp.]|uniref:Transcriptional repressor NrdR n=1 Tax=Sulfoacidibacillus ferrooxidans TaxID=2005001 RepID=A0A9X2ADC7_9BACL|nr:transcriptional regulator NrdR [Sulfoacidibacillus ferrooxidans]MCI0183265.1 Transcriptional repressor NrdR [Sulfoacidibacillus ferrooxidans]MCY0893796.1 transcriptional regulator NrdR [Acidibacillus sp.]